MQGFELFAYSDGPGCTHPVAAYLWFHHSLRMQLWQLSTAATIAQANWFYGCTIGLGQSGLGDPAQCD